MPFAKRISSIKNYIISMVIDIPILKCNQCGHKWTPRTEDPRICPKCHSLRWDKEKRSGNEISKC